MGKVCTHIFNYKDKFNLSKKSMLGQKMNSVYF